MLSLAIQYIRAFIDEVGEDLKTYLQKVDEAKVFQSCSERINEIYWDHAVAVNALNDQETLTRVKRFY